MARGDPSAQQQQLIPAGIDLILHLKYLLCFIVVPDVFNIGKPDNIAKFVVAAVEERTQQRSSVLMSCNQMFANSIRAKTMSQGKTAKTRVMCVTSTQ